MITNAKQFALIMADLKTKIAEKDAILKGGFGSISALALGEMPNAQPTGQTPKLPPLEQAPAPAASEEQASVPMPAVTFSASS